MKKVLAFDVDQTLNIAKTPIPTSMAELLKSLLLHYEICPISGQKFDQFLIQIVNPLIAASTPVSSLAHLHLFVAQGTQYYRYAGTGDTYDETAWEQVYSYPLNNEDVVKITTAIEESAKELGFWEAEQLAEGDEIIENRLSQVTFSALGQNASTEAKYAWDPDHSKRAQIVTLAKSKAPEFDYEIGGTTSINAIKPGMNKEFGMNKLIEHLGVLKNEILYFGDMTQPGGNDYPVVQMGIDTITVRTHEDTEYALRGILALQDN